MKKLTIVLTLISVLAFAGVAFGEAVIAFGDSDVDIALPGKEGYRLCISGFQYDADGATDDITFYGSSGDKTYLTGDEAIGQTVFASATTAAVSGIGTTAITVLQRANGLYAEYGLLASFTAKAPTWTAATTAPFYEGDELVEMDLVLHTFNNVGTDAAEIENPHGLFCGPPNSPVLAIASAGAWFEYMSGFYVPNEALEGPVGAFSGLAAGMIALPGKPGARIVVSGIGADLNAADDDVNVVTWTGLNTGKSHYTADEAIGQTSLSVLSDPGFSDTAAYVISERADGSYAELHKLSGYATTTMTSGALVHAFKEDDVIYETEALRITDDFVAAAYTLSNEHGLFTVPAGYPVGVYSEESDGVLDYVIGYYDPVGGREILATMIPDDTATGAVGAKAALPGFPGKRTCITSFSYDPTTASTDELYLYTAVQPFDSAIMSGDKAAASTTILWNSREGADNFADDAYVVIQRPDGTSADLMLLTAASSTGATITAAHMTQAYPAGSTVFEMETNAAHFTLTDPVADAATVYENPNGLFCGPVGSPVAIRIAGANSQIEYMTGFAE